MLCLQTFYKQQQQQLSHLSQVFGGRLHEPKENYARSGTWISFLRSFLSSNMPSLRFLVSISCRITSIHVFFGLPCALLTCPNLIRYTRRTGASIGLRSTCPNHRWWFSLIFSSIGATLILVRRSSFLTLSILVLPHIQRSMHISVTLIFWAWYLFITQHFVSYNKADLIAVRKNFLFSHNGILRLHKTPVTLPISTSRLGSYGWHHYWSPHLLDNEPKYLKWLLVGISCSFSVTIL